MSERGDSEAEAGEEINVDDSDSGCSGSSPAPPGGTRPDWSSEGVHQVEAPRSSHPFSISRLLAEDDDISERPDDKSPDDRFQSAQDFLAPFRLLPGAAGLLYTGGGVIRVPAHRPPGSQGLAPPFGPLAAHGGQQQHGQAAAAAAAAGLQTARFLANLAAHPLQGHPYLKDRLAGKFFFS